MSCLGDLQYLYYVTADYYCSPQLMLPFYLLLYSTLGLDVYSTHVLLLSACTSMGCTNSSQVTVVTSQLPPGPLQAPTLTLLDSRTILVE